MTSLSRFSLITPNLLEFKGKSTKEIISTKGWATYARTIKTAPSKLAVVPAGCEGRADLLSYRIYGTSDYWWVICVANNIIDPFEQLKAGRQIRVPLVGGL